jgi:hypothetical protein
VKVAVQPVAVGELREQEVKLVRVSRSLRGHCPRAVVAPALCPWNTACMPSLPGTFVPDVFSQPLRAQFDAFLDEHRALLNACLDGLTEEQARRSLVPSRTTLLGLVKHATFVEKVWFDEAITCRSARGDRHPGHPG